MKKTKPPASLLETFHPLSNDWAGANLAFDLLEKFLEDRHSVLRCYPGFSEAFPKWQKELGQAKRIRARVLKMIWDAAHEKSKQK